MRTLRNVIDRIVLAFPAASTAGTTAHPGDRRPAAADPRRAASECDPYMRDAREARQLIAEARLISSVDGSPAAVLNMNAMRSRKAA